VRAALERVSPTAVVVTDGAPAEGETRAAVLGRADVVRANRAEAARLAGRELRGVEEARAAAAELLTAGSRLVSLSVGAAGDLVAWRAGPALGAAADELEADPRWADDDVVIPLLGEPPSTRRGRATPPSLRSPPRCSAAPARRTPRGPPR
jgi:ribokinase